jgi:signal transduction histidine kinase
VGKQLVEAIELERFLQLLERSLSGDPEDSRRLRQARTATQQARRLAILVDDLVDLTRLQMGRLTLQLEEVDLVELAAGVVEVAQTLANDQTIEGHFPNDGLTAVVDPGRVEQVALNLVTNAIAHGRGERVDVRLRRSGGHAELQVQDWGAGIPATELPNVFERFYQGQHGSPSSAGQPGLGLGLFIAHEFVTAHGGTISVESKVGEGATFTVRLPLVGPHGAGSSA